MAKLNGFILYEGASVLDGAPIVVIATMRTDNPKTGAMVQTWIIRSDIDPMAASKEGLDSSVCGNCPLRHSLGGACYVTIFQAPLAILQAAALRYPKQRPLGQLCCLHRGNLGAGIVPQAVLAQLCHLQQRVHLLLSRCFATLRENLIALQCSNVVALSALEVTA